MSDTPDYYEVTKEKDGSLKIKPGYNSGCGGFIAFIIFIVVMGFILNICGDGSSESKKKTTKETYSTSASNNTSSKSTSSTSASNQGSSKIDITGTWVGEQNSVISFKAGNRCEYSEPANVNNIVLRRGLNCEYQISNGQVSVTGINNYTITASIPADGSELRFTSSSSIWTPETFKKVSASQVKAVNEKDCYLLPSNIRGLTEADLDALSKDEVRK